MTSEKGTKINQLLKQWPSGTVAVLRWLARQGVYQQLVHEYEKSAWILRVGQGAFAKSGDKIDWTGGLFALQNQLALPIYAGGKTALQLQGYAHFLPLGKGSTVFLFGPTETKLPAWFLRYQWGLNIRFASTRLFADEAVVGLTMRDMGAFSIRVSAPERAMMEVLYFAPKEQSYEEARLLMEGLTTPRVKIVQSLLESCTSVKVKRLFMVLAESCGHAWVKKIDVSKVNFGKGRRMLVRGGKLNNKYNISVPSTGESQGTARREL